MMTDFAKLFRVDGIGQILITTGENEEGDPCVIIRIPDTPDAILETLIVEEGMDYDKAAEICKSIFDATDEAGAIKASAVLVKARDRMLAAREVQP